MYLVELRRYPCEVNHHYYSPKLERLQSFEYQLCSKDWSVIDCVPEKGASFEVHFGGKNSEVNSIDGLEYTTVGVGIASDTLLALKLIGLMDLWIRNDTITEDDMISDIQSEYGLMLFFFEDAVGSESLITKLC